MKKFLKKLGYFIGRKNALGFPVRYDEQGKEYVDAPAFTFSGWEEVVDPISRKDVIKWIAALRSGKYGQGTGCLYSEADNNFCCLGVLAKIESNISEGGYFMIDGKQECFTALRSWEESYYCRIPESLQAKYMKLNDDGPHTFEDIAHIIETDFNIV